jgi:phosphatidylglycerol lysyltransferase
MEALLLKYGYVLLFLGVAVEGEAFLLTGAFLARLGDFHFLWVILIAIAANCFADQVYYVVARTRGKRWLDARYAGHPRYRRMLEIYSRHRNWLLLVSRFVYGFRILIPAACGAFGMPPLTFTFINLLAGILWAVPMALLAYYFGGAVLPLLQNVHHYQIWAVATLALVIAAVLSVRYLWRLPFIRGLKVADIHRVVPMVIGFMGLINLFSAVFPRSYQKMTPLESWLPLDVSQRSRPIMLFSGLVLLQVTGSLRQHKALAWYVATIALGISLLLHITHAFDLHHSLVAGLLLTYLIYFRRRFYARSDPVSVKRALIMIPLIGLFVLLYGTIGLHNLRAQFNWESATTPLSEAFQAGILIMDPNVNPLTEHAARFLGSLQIAGWLGRLYILILLLRPVILRYREKIPQEAITEIFNQQSRNSLSAFAIQSDKHHLLVTEGRGLVAYVTRGSVAIACGDPLSSENDFKVSVQEFLSYCRKNGWTPCIYESAELWLPVYQGLGLRSLKIAEEAILDLQEFSLAGGKRAKLRSMVHKIAKTEMKVWQYDRKNSPNPAIDEQLETISEDWLKEKRLGELGFTIGGFSLEDLNQVYVFVCGTKDKIEAFCSWLPYRQGKAVVLDLMRKRRSAVSGTMDFLLTHSLFELQKFSILEASLANAPLANVAELRGPLDRGVALLFENMNFFYGYKNLFQFKNKFAPCWTGRYLIYPPGANLVRIAYALAKVHHLGGLWKLLKRK